MVNICVKCCKVPKAVVLRMGKYFRWLNTEGRYIETVSSEHLAKNVCETAPRVRHDFAYFGDFSIQGKGYNAEKLRKRIANILGLDRSNSVIMVGSGRMGCAMVKSGLFEDFDLNLKYRFVEDVTEEKLFSGTIALKAFGEMDDCIQKEKPCIAIICTEDDQAQNISMHLYELGIRFFMNTTKSSLVLPEAAMVENISLDLSLMSLSYNLTCKRSYTGDLKTNNTERKIGYVT